MTGAPRPHPFRLRRALVLALFACAFTALAARAVHLQVFNRDFLQEQAAARHLRVVEVPAHRGMILDRHGDPLAISTPVDSVWANPQELAGEAVAQRALARVLALDLESLQRLLAARAGREFVYLRRHVDPERADAVRALDLPGVYLQREYRRYYPTGEVAGHVLGFTDIDDVGQEGLELAFDDWLRGEPGAKRVLKDGRRHTVRDVESIRAPRPGRDLVLSLDRRLQYLAYRELKAAVREHNAVSGSVVVLDVSTGEVLAMVNQPAYNPNDRGQLRSRRVRNRAVTDVFEPGSTLKPFVVNAALASGDYRPDTPVETAPGYMRVAGNTVRDVRNHGLLDVAGVLRESSNVGAAKIALSLEPQRLWSALKAVGLGMHTGSGFPGEAAGLLSHYRRWREFEVATLAFGYGLSVTPLQLAQAYAVLAADGYRRPVSFLRQDEPPAGERVLDPAAARQVRHMLEAVVGPEGTAPRAAVSGYRVAGKTGTVKKAVAGGYAEDRYLAVFAGMAPASRPRLVAAVLINEPRGEDYYGGLVAGPVFSRIMGGALRLLDIPPDDLPLLHTRGDGREGPA